MPPIGKILIPAAIADAGDVVRGTCDDRAELYPATPIRLAAMLRAWAVTEQGFAVMAAVVQTA